MPGVEDLVAALGYEEHAQVGLTGSEHARPTVFVHQAHEMQIVGKLAAGNEGPAAAQPAAPVRGHGPSGRSCGAREQPTGGRKAVRARLHSRSGTKNRPACCSKRARTPTLPRPPESRGSSTIVP